MTDRFDTSISSVTKPIELMISLAFKINPLAPKGLPDLKCQHSVLASVLSTQVLAQQSFQISVLLILGSIISSLYC